MSLRQAWCLAAACLCLVAACPAWAQPFRLGDRPPTPEEQAYLDEHVVEVSTIAPTALSQARAAAEALEAGLSPSAMGGPPSAADNSTSIHFPPIGSQGGQGSCTCWAACYYYNSYTQARDEGVDISGGDNTRICSPAFMYPLINRGYDRGATASYAVARLNDIGSCSLATMPYSASDYLTWPTEAAWIEALQWRTQTACSVDGGTASGLDAIKQHLANGNVAVARFTVYANFWQYPNNTTGINNRVYYFPVGAVDGGHAVTLVGYDDNKSYVDHRDGQTHYGAFLAANSWGAEWGWYNSTGEGSKGYFWVAYEMFAEWTFGPYAYYNDDRPQYEPSFYAVTGINHAQRGRVSYRGGVGPVGAAEFYGPYPIDRDGGYTIAITDAKRVAVDLSDGADLIEPGVPNPVFVELAVRSTATSNGTMTSADFVLDLDGDGTYETFSSADPVVTVAPGATGYATAVVTVGPRDIYVDDSNTGGPWDGTPEHPFRTIRDGLDAAEAGDTVRVRPGTYTGRVVIINDVALIGAGADTTTIDAQNVGEAIVLNGVTEGLVAGFTLTSGGTTYTALRAVDSTATVRDCVATGSRSGFGAGQTGRLTLVNCLAAGNAYRGVWQDGSADVTIANATVVGNGESGVVRWGTGAVTLTNSILWGNGDDVSGTGVTASHCDIGDGDFAGTNGNISQHPLFVSGPLHDYYLSQWAAGQGLDSPCVDAGSDTAATLGLDEATTRTDGVPDAGVVDMGYHAERPLWISDVYWNQATTSVVLRFISEAGVEYVLEAAEANAYADNLAWTDLTTVTAAGVLTTLNDNLSTSPLGAAYRFYRVKRADESECSRQTVGVFEITLPVEWTRTGFLISSPLVPDPDYAGMQAVLGTQLNYTNVNLARLVPDTGLFARMTYAPSTQTWSGEAFGVAAGEAYLLEMGDALPGAYTLRLTGAVPAGALTVSLKRPSFAVTGRWIAYSMPRPTTLGELGLETAITPSWNPDSTVRLMPLGASVWSAYRWDGVKWYNVTAPSVDAGGTPIACGEGIVFVHCGMPGQPDTLTWPTWFVHPPNAW